MSYYRVLGLEREPFSTSPDPDFLYRSPSHKAALHRLEIAIRLRRGLSLLLGDVGTGKTTLARTLIQAFRNEPQFVFHIILDPHYKSRSHFEAELCRSFGVETRGEGCTAALENHLFQKGVIENKVVVLIIDEAQKLSLSGIEVLRTLLNYETNEFKLLQLVIMGQLEFLAKGGRTRNFMDRVAFRYLLNPLDEDETRSMIDYRLFQAGCQSGQELFTAGAIREIYNYTKGYPRRITFFCHQVLENMIMRECRVADGELIKELIKEEIDLYHARSLVEEPPPARAITEVVS